MGDVEGRVETMKPSPIFQGILEARAPPLLLLEKCSYREIRDNLWSDWLLSRADKGCCQLLAVVIVHVGVSQVLAAIRVSGSDLRSH